jgi:hypothetical protein
VILGEGGVIADIGCSRLWRLRYYASIWSHRRYEETVIIYRFWYLFVGWVKYARDSRIYTSVVVL